MVHLLCIVFLSFFSQIFSNITSGIDYTLHQDLKKVYCSGKSLEARWSSTGGHRISSNKPLLDVPFKASQMYLLIACLSNDSGNFQWPLISLKQTLLAQISRCIFLIFDSEIYNTLLQDHVKVKCFWGSSEARWSSNGGCDISSFEPLHVTNKFYFLLILTLEVFLDSEKGLTKR